MTFRLLSMTSALALAAASASADGVFNRIASFATPLNNADAGAVSSAEIIAASDDGMTLIYTDSPLGVVGLIDITDPKAPVAKGNVDMGGEPTAVSVVGNTAFVAVNTSESYANPSGMLKSVDLATGTVTAECDLGGQPDSTAPAKDGSFIAVAIENERDEDAGDGRVGQMPAGFLVKAMLTDGQLSCNGIKVIDLTGLADISPEDPEPEFVDVNEAGEIAVTLQENNHIVIVGADDTVMAHFSAGSVDLTGIDTTDEQAALRFDQDQPGRLREPDGLQWIDADHFFVANEGDMDGGSRGFTVFDKTGVAAFESGASFETPIIQAGHYPDRRSDAKGAEPEGAEFAVIGGVPMAFVLSERASTVSIYDMTDPANPVFRQLLPSGVSPEGAMAIPSRNLLVTANEVDLVEDGLSRAHVMIYEYQDGAAPAYPTLTSEGADSLIGWGALSGLAKGEGSTFYAINDSFFGYQPTIFTIDAAQTPARITAATPLIRAGFPAQKIDMEGVALDGEGGFWVASEGRTDRMIPHGIYHVKADGKIDREIPLPAELLAVETRFGFEGIALVGNSLWMPVQREWADDEAGFVKIVSYNLETKEWGAVRYPLEAKGEGWIGLSEIAVMGDHAYFIERDNQVGGAAVTKLITRVALADMVAAPLGGDLPVVTKEIMRDLIPDLVAQNGYVAEKIEGLAFDADGNAWIVTDNDGVDDSSGETFFVNLGKL